MNNFFIIKADDLHLMRIRGGWRHFLYTLEKHCLRADLGIVGRSVVPRFRLKSLILKQELFLHGYYHEIREYQNSSLSRQVELIAKTKDKLQQAFGINANIFGAPGNNIDKNTIHALKRNSIKIWFFGYDDQDGVIVNLRNKLSFEFSEINPEKYRRNRVYGKWWHKKVLNGWRFIQRDVLNSHMQGICHFDELMERYKAFKDKHLVVGEIHPHEWSKKDLQIFVRFMYYIQKVENCKVVTASEYIRCKNTP